MDLYEIVFEHAIAEVEQQVPQPRGPVEIPAGGYALGEQSTGVHGFVAIYAGCFAAPTCSLIIT